LTHVIKVWCTEFDREDEGETRRDVMSTTKRRGEKRKDEKVSYFPSYLLPQQLALTHITNQLLEGGLALKPIVHEIRIQNQVIFLDPPIEYARQTWIQQLHEWLGA
jgi:hypothetical protein